VLAEFPALPFGIGNDGLTQAPGLVAGLVGNRASGPGCVAAGSIDVLDEHQGDRRGFTEPAAGQTEHEHRAVAFEFDVSDRSAIGHGKSDGLPEAQHLC
jgi:hypothetical protein